MRVASVLQCVVVCYIAECSSVLQCVAVCCSVLQCVAVLQVCCRDALCAALDTLVVLLSAHRSNERERDK